MENSKITKSATVVDKILKIVLGFMRAGVIVAAIFIPLVLIFGEKMVVDSQTLSFGSLSIVIAGDYFGFLNHDKLKFSIVMMLIAVIVMCLVGWYAVKVLRQVVEPMKEGAPFAAGTSDKLRKFGWVVIIGGGLGEIFKVLESSFELSAYKLDSLFNNAVVSTVKYNINIDGWFIVTGLIIFFLSFIFRYGEELQKESDETL